MWHTCRGRSTRVFLTVVGLMIVTSASRADLLVSSFRGGNVLRYSSQTGAFQGQLVASNDGLGGTRMGMVMGADNYLYVSGDAGIGRYNVNTGELIDVIDTGGQGGYVSSVFGPDGDYYVSNHWNDFVERFDGQTMASKGVFATDANLIEALGVAFGPSGDLYVSSYMTNQVLRFDGQTGAYVSALSAPGQLMGTWGLVFTPGGDLLVSSHDNDQILRFDGDGTLMGVFASGGALDGPRDMKFGPDGYLYVVSTNNSSVVRYDEQTGAFVDVFVASGRGGLVDPKHILFVVPEPASMMVWMLGGLVLLRRTSRYAKK